MELAAVQNNPQHSPGATQIHCLCTCNHDVCICMCSNLSNFNHKPQVESRQQHLALYMDRQLRLAAIVIEVTSRHTECTHFNLDYSQMLAVAPQW